MSNVAIDLTKTVKEIITTMKTAIDNLNSDVATNKTAIDNLKSQILEAVYPVGSVYVSITDSRNPSAILGFGTWEALPAGYGLVAQGTATAEDGSTLTFTAGEKSGEFKHQLTVGELPKITGDAQFRLSGGSSNIVGDKNDIATEDGCFEYLKNAGSLWKSSLAFGSEATKNTDILHMEFGENKAHSNISPNIASYMWRRTA